MYAIEIHNLKKTYANGTRALNGVSLTIEQGDFFALLGANGAGKTTLISILCGLVSKTEGAVSVLGIDAEQDPDATRAMLGVVPQEFNFNIFEKVEDIVLAQAGYYGVPRSVAAPRVDQLLKDLSLWDKRHTKAMELSGGMKRRLMIARALVHQPKVLILDEPTAGVDVELRRGMWEYLRALNAQGTTILLTTHYLEEVEQLCRNMAIVHKGEVVRQGSVKSMLAAMERQVFLATVGDEDIEVTVDAGQSLMDALRKLEASGKKIDAVRPSTNRLEQLFLDVMKR